MTDGLDGVMRSMTEACYRFVDSNRMRPKGDERAFVRIAGSAGFGNVEFDILRYRIRNRLRNHARVLTEPQKHFLSEIAGGVPGLKYIHPTLMGQAACDVWVLEEVGLIKTTWKVSPVSVALPLGRAVHRVVQEASGG